MEKMAKQVEVSHYDFISYMQDPRWQSMRQQIVETLYFSPESVLEIGPGAGVFKAILGTMEISVDTVDIDPELNPTFVAAATDIPVSNSSYDVVCAFQVLEHMPYSVSLQALAEMHRIARKGVIISIPNSSTFWRYIFHIPKIGEKVFLLPRPGMKKKPDGFDGQHYWELNKSGYHIDKVLKDFSGIFGLDIVRSYIFKGNPYHYFCVFSKG